MSTLERLKQQKDFYTTNNVTAVPVSILLDLWRELPKLLALVDAGKKMRNKFWKDDDDDTVHVNRNALWNAGKEWDEIMEKNK